MVLPSPLNAVLPTDVHTTPSVEVQPDTFVPLRTSLIHIGAVPLAPTNVVAPPTVTRCSKASPTPGDISSATWRASGGRPSRIIRPAFAHTFVFCTLTTRATICPSP